MSESKGKTKEDGKIEKKRFEVKKVRAHTASPDRSLCEDARLAYLYVACSVERCRSVGMGYVHTITLPCVRRESGGC